MVVCSRIGSRWLVFGDVHYAGKTNAEMSG